MSDKGILDWFGKRKESSVSHGAREHAMVVHDTAAELKNAFAGMASGDTDAAMKSTERLELCCDEAGRMEDRLCAEISRGEFSVQEREYFIRFVRQTDRVADWSKEAAIYLQLIVQTRASVPGEIWEEVGKMSSELVEEARLLAAAIETLGGEDANETYRDIDALNDQERIIDGLYFQALKHAHLSDMQPKDLYLLDRIIEAIEMAADSGKACGDTISTLISSRGI